MKVGPENFAFAINHMDLRDPLTINFSGQLRWLRSRLPDNSVYAPKLINASLDTLSELLIAPELTLLVAEAFAPLLLDICARFLENDERVEQKLVALCLLMDPFAQVFP